MNETPNTVVVQIPSQLVAEIEAVATGTDLESFVFQAIQSYLEAVRRHQWLEQLAKDYDELATIYSELTDELTDEVWLPLENEALLTLDRDHTV